MSMRILSVLLILLLIPTFTAMPIKMVSPVQKTLADGDEVFIGTIGPGQTIEVQIYPKVTSGGIYGKGGLYDLAEVTSKPAGWSSEASKLYGNPLQVKITAAKDAPAGSYISNITVIDEKNGEELGNVTLLARINVTWDVLDLEVTPAKQTVGIDQPAQYVITVTNKGSASDTYTVSASGAKQWEFVKPIYIPAQSSRTVIYELSANEEEQYSPTIKVVSSSSNNIHTEKNVSFEVKSDLLGDYKATNNGVLLFPVFEAPIYSLAGLVAALLGSLGF
jgi:hypothetical protein